MKKPRMLTMILALALTVSLSAPALAWEYAPAKYPTFQGYLDFYRSCDDADTHALADYIDDMLAEDPDLPETFDADAWFEENLADPGLGVTKENWLFQNGPFYDENHFRAEMLNYCLTWSYRAWRDANSATALAAQYPEDFASFDADAWFAGYYGGIVGVSKEDYMSREALAEEDFRLDMFAEWAGREMGFYNSLCVTVDGTPIQFQLYRGLDGLGGEPTVENQRILLPVRAIAEALDFTVEYQPETSSVVCAKDGRTITFVLGQAEYTVQQGEAVETLTLDIVPFAEAGRTYLPLRALGEALGCTVTWKQEFGTAALTTAP